MLNWRGLAASLTISLSLTGCGGGEKTETTEASTSETSAAKTTNVSRKTSEDATAGPRAALTKFLNAIKAGDDEGAAAMLTPLALQKTTEYGLNVTPQRSDSAKFQVTQVEMKGTTGAYAACRWTEVDDQGQESTDEVVWVLALQDDQWRVAGMVAKVFPDMEAIVFNFEDPEDMIRKQELAVQEMQRRAGVEEGQSAEISDATAPESTDPASPPPAAQRSPATRR